MRQTDPQLHRKKFNMLPLIGVWMLYPVLFLILEPKLGFMVTSFGLVPVLVSGAYFGKRGGAMGGMFFILINIGLGYFSAGNLSHIFEISNLVGSTIILLLGTWAGYFFEIQGRLKFELQARKLFGQELAANNQEIERQKQTLEALIQNSPIAIVTLDNEDQINRCNPAFLRLFEYQENEALGINIDDLIVPQHAREEARNLTKSATGAGELIHCLGQRLSKSGKLLDVEIFGVPLTIEGNRRGALALYHDLTEQKQLMIESSKLTMAVEQSATPIFITDVNGVIEYANTVFLEVAGFSEEEVIGQTPRIMKSGQMSADFYQTLWKTILSGEPISAVVTNMKKNGQLWYYEQTIKPLIDAKGNITNFLSTGKDITAQIKLEKILMDSEERFRMLFEESPIALWEEDFSGVKQYIDGLQRSGIPDLRKHFDQHPEEIEKILRLVRIVDINQAVLTLTGAEDRSELFEKLPSLASEKEMEVWKEQFIALGEGKTRIEIESSLKTIQGELKNTIIRTSIPDGYLHTWMRVLVSMNDISELKEIEADLRVAKIQAEQATKIKAAFLANMSHEIRTPLNAVVGMASLLIDTALDQEQQDYLNTIRASTDTLLATINDILDFSKIEAGKIDLEERPFHLGELVEASLDLLAPKAATKQIELAYIIADNVPQYLIGDETHLRQILANLLSNAVKFTDQGEVVVDISSQALGNERYKIHIAVRDTGIGIPPDRMDRMFKSFSQVDASTTRKYGGTGLGLVISQQLAGLMGGEIWAESELGSGSTFHFTIPLQAQITPDRRASDLEQIDLSGKRILIVDDNATNRLILKQYAGKWGLLATEACSANQALELVDHGHHFDIVILDYQMPGMDGCALAKELRENPATKSMPMIMLSSLGNQKPCKEMVEQFSAFLNKPIKPSQLLDVLVAVLAGKPIESQKKVVSTQFDFDPEMGVRTPLKMLLVEDNLVNQKVATKLLKKFGFEVDMASNGVDAVQLLEKQSYDVVFMDIQMPEMDGEEATKLIRQDQSAKEQPWIIAMTAHALEGDREHFLSSGMDDYISKPLNVVELRRVLERIPIKEVSCHV
jgi:PAS domain S-box-containing protein